MCPRGVREVFDWIKYTPEAYTAKGYPDWNSYSIEG